MKVQKDLNGKLKSKKDSEKCPLGRECKDCPFDHPESVPNAKPIHNSRKNQLDRYDEKDPEVIEREAVRYLKKHGNEFGEEITKIGKILNVDYELLNEICKGSEKMEVYELSRANRVRLIRSVVGW